MEGTYPLPEAQRDRFMARVSMGYPDATAELAMLDAHAAGDPAGRPRAGRRRRRDRRSSIEVVSGVHVAARGRPYAVDLVAPPAARPDLRLGASPRATLHLLRAAKAAAALDGRDYVLPDDVQQLAVPVLAHRLLLTAEAQIARRGAEQIVADIVSRTPVPDAG